MTPKKSDHAHRLISQSSVRPAVAVDCSTWSSNDTERRVSGQFVKQSSVRPAVAVDCSDWSASAPIYLQLILHPIPDANAAQLALGLLEVLCELDKLDVTLGGGGLTRMSAEQSNGIVTINLAPQQLSGAESRIRQICNQLNRTSPSGDEFSLPPVVKMIKAKVA